MKSQNFEKTTLQPSISSCVSLAAVLLACACALALLAGCSGNAAPTNKTTGDSSSTFAAEVRDAEEDGHADNALPNAEASSLTSESASKASADLSSRDKDFAVDPDRKTDWNYDGNGKKTVYLTIDDGPSELTQQVLDILDKYDCKATFFVVGLNPDYYPMIKEAYDRGHTIGLHSYTHDYATVYASEEAFYADLDAIGQVVKDQIGYVPCFIRFPGGASNAISADYCSGIMSSLVESVQAKGYQYYDWNMSVGDGSEHTTDEIIGYGTEPTELENIMLLCHDSATKQSTVDALPSIIEHYQKLGYTFEAIDRNSFVAHHGVSN